MSRRAAIRDSSAESGRNNFIESRQTGGLRINLRHLRALTAVVAAGSVAGAAEGMYRVRSAVTRSILELEAALGRQLFDRRSGRLALNAYGRLVLVRARRIEKAFEEARAQLVARGGIRSSADVQALFASILNGRRLAILASLAEKRNIALHPHFA